MVEPCHHRGRLTEIPFEMDNPDPAILIGETIQHLIGQIGAAVVDKD
jgi:hypothetical protein